MTPAERTRAYRKRKALHDKNEHHECLPKSCAIRATAESATYASTARDNARDVTRDVTAPPENPVTNVPPPAGLGVRGASLWERTSGPGFSPLHLALLEEACRVADTLERLHEQVEGGDWLELVRAEAESGESATEIRVVVNGLLVERRQQLNNFRLAVAELRLAGRTSAPGVATVGGSLSAPTEEPDSAPGEGGGLGDLIHAASRFRTSEG